MKKLLLSAVLIAACGVTALAQTFYPVPNEAIDENGGYMLLGMSPNGRYICGSTMNQTGFVLDLATGRAVFSTPADDLGSEYRQVNDLGVAIGFNGPACTLDVHTGEEKIVWDNTEAYTTLGNAISADGSVMVGDIANGNMMADPDANWQTKGVVWKDGEMTILPVPTSEEMGFEVSGTKANYVSADGSLIVGKVIDNMSTYPIIVWRLQDDGTYKLDPVCKGKFCDDMWKGKGPYFAMTPSGISPNGKYAALYVAEYAGFFTEETPEGTDTVSMQSGYRPALLDLETGEMKITPYREMGENWQTGEPEVHDIEVFTTGVADNGTMLGWAGGMMERKAVIIEAGSDTVMTLAAIFPEMESLALYDANSLNSPIGISADGNNIAGFGMGETGFEAYVISFDGDPVANGINCPKAVRTETGTAKRYYTIDGRKATTAAKGLLIEKTGDGQVRKIVK